MILNTSAFLWSPVAINSKGQREGIAIAKKADGVQGRKPSLTAEQVKEIRRRVKAGEQKTGLATEYGVSGRRSTPH
jgi:hypothetical protein